VHLNGKRKKGRFLAMKKVMTLVVIMVVLLATALPAFAGTGGFTSGGGPSDVGGYGHGGARSSEDGGGFGGGYGGKGIGGYGGRDGYGKKDAPIFMLDPHGPACDGG
jgi:hypothetical protein